MLNDPVQKLMMGVNSGVHRQRMLLPKWKINWNVSYCRDFTIPNALNSITYLCTAWLRPACVMAGFFGMGSPTDYGRPVRKSPSLHSRKSTLTPKFFGRPKPILHAALAKIFKFIWFMPSLGVRSPNIYTVATIVEQSCRIEHRDHKVGSLFRIFFLFLF